MRTLRLTTVLCLISWSAWSQIPPPTPAPSTAPAANDQLASAAMAAFDAGNFQDSYDKLDQLLSKDEIRNTKDLKILQALEPVYYVKAAALYNLKRYEEAIKAFQDYLAAFRAGNRKDDAVYSLANSYIALKKYDEALAELAKLEQAPEFREEALLASAGIYYEKKDFKSAVRPLTQLTEKGFLTASAIRAGVMLGSIYTQLGQFDKATGLLIDLRRNFDRVDNKAQFNATVLQLGDKLFNAGLPGEAQVIYEMVQTKDELIASQKVTILKKQKEAELALETFRQSKDISALRRRDRLQNEVKQDEASLDLLEKTPDFMLSVLIRRGRAYSEFGRQHEAIIIYDHIIDNFPEAKEERDIAAYSRILAFVELGKADAAIEAATDYLDHFPDGNQRDTATYLRGALSLDSNNPQKAATFFGTALTQADDAMKKSELYPKMLFLLGVAKFSLNDYAGAAEQFTDYKTKYPSGDFLQESEYRSALCTLLGDREIGYKKAVQLFEDYLKKYPNGDFSTDAEYRIAVCHMSAGEHATVIKDCEEWIRKHPSDQMTGEVLALKADALLAKGDKPAAAACYNESAGVATSDDVLMYSLMEAAKHYQDLGDWAAMDTMFRRFLEKYPDHPGAVAAYFYIGQAMIKQGKVPEGKAFLAGKIQESISDPHKEAVERLLTQLVQLCVKKPKLPPEPAAAPAAPSVAGASPTPEPTPRPKPDPSIELEEFLATFPDTPAGKARKLFARSELATMRHKPEESTKYLNELADSVQPEDLSPMLLGKVGDLLLARGNDAKAKEMYDQIIGGYARSDFADYGYVGRGELAMRAGRYDEALKYFSFAADESAASSKLKEATLGKAKALLALKKYPEAEKIFEMIAGLKEWRGEATAESLLHLGQIAQENKDYPKAIAYYQRIFLTHQKYPKIVAKAYLDSALCFKELGKTVEAKNTYAEMLRNEKLKSANVPELAEAQKQYDHMKPLLLLALVVTVLVPEGIMAQEIFLKNGSRFPLKNPRRQGDMLMLSVAVPGAAGSAEVGYKVSDVDKIEMPVPPAVDVARSQLYTGKPAEAVKTIKPAFEAVSPLRGMTGSNWEEIALLYAAALQAAGQTPEAITVLEQFEGASPNGSSPREIARVRLAGLKTPQETAVVVGVADNAIAAKLGSEVTAEANTVAGDACLANKSFDEALNRYLRVVIFCPGNRWLGARSLLGAAKAMGSLNEKKNCVRALREITASYPGSPQAEVAAKMLSAGGKDYQQLSAEIDADEAGARQRLIDASTNQSSK